MWGVDSGDNNMSENTSEQTAGMSENKPFEVPSRIISGERLGRDDDSRTIANYDAGPISSANPIVQQERECDSHTKLRSEFEDVLVKIPEATVEAVGDGVLGSIAAGPDPSTVGGSPQSGASARPVCPSDGQDRAITVVRAPIVAAPNAQVGRQYEFQIPQVDIEGSLRHINAVNLSSECGLWYEPSTNTIKGEPLHAGPVAVEILWSAHSTETQNFVQRLMIEVVADPRSLWREVEPAESERFPKEHSMHQTLTVGGFRVVAASRRGRSHAHVGKFREDDFHVGYESGNDTLVVAVADGLGSAELSRQGSRIAVRATCNEVLRALSEKGDRALSQCITPWAEVDSNKLTADEVRKAASACMDFVRELIADAVRCAVMEITNVASAEGRSSRDYATTLLVLIAKRLDDGRVFGASYWVGDGAIAVVGPVGTVRLLGLPDSGEFAGQTKYLSDKEIHASVIGSRISVGIWSEISHMFVMTDGVSDAKFESDEQLLNGSTWAAFSEELAAISEEATSETLGEKLVDWLGFFSPGNHDDRTLVCVLPV